MLYLGSNPETVETWRTLYLRPKIVLFVLIFLLSPSPPRTLVPSDKSITSSAKLESQNVFVSNSPLQDKDFSFQTPTTASIEFSGELASTSPLTKSFNSKTESVEVNIPDDSERRITHHHPRGYTESSENNQTQDLPIYSTLDANSQQSEPSTSPPVPSASSTPETPPECLQTDERGRPLCNRTHQSIHERWSEVSNEAWKIWKLGWWSWLGWLLPGASNIGVGWKGWMLVTGVMGMLLFIELIALAVEDEIIKGSFSKPPVPSFPKPASSLSKRFSRVRFQILHSFKQHLKPLLLLSSCFAIVMVIFKTVWSGEDKIAGFLVKNEGLDSKKGLGGFDWEQMGRVIILAECLTCLGTFMQPVKHLLPSSLLPPIINPPFYSIVTYLVPPPKKYTAAGPSMSRRSRRRQGFFNQPVQRIPGEAPPLSEGERETQATGSEMKGGVKIESKWFIALGVEGWATFCALAQYIAVALTLRSLYPHSPCLIFTTFSLRSRVHHLSKLLRSYEKTVECLKVVLNTFPFFTGDEGDDEEWRCSICFEGKEACSAVESEEREKNGPFGEIEGTRCRLFCGHVYHLSCLVGWLYYRDFCCICHTTISRPPSG